MFEADGVYTLPNGVQIKKKGKSWNLKVSQFASPRNPD